MKNFAHKLPKNPFIIHLFLMAVVSCAVVFGVLKWLDIYTHHNEAVEVPDVKGLSVDEAAVLFQKSGLRYNLIDSVSSKDVAPGAIVEIVPHAGSKVKEGRIIFVAINAFTSQQAGIPAVEDLSVRQAYALLKTLGFNAVQTKYVPGNYRDLAIGVELYGRILYAGERVALNAPLLLIVSDGQGGVAIDSTDLSDPPVELLNNEETWF
ncbi:Serine/threonine-protein kinase PrkC [Bacteroidales bacterium Barb6]|nr:Serine/threonine-protein kinase PrkC [Bacteroidales bacterium Barb6XT]OAV73522.1 Serine/threonine-protein kinase PrkC [Bacteroidales bacterium Barb6]OAV73527.1 Serine/threonine-protein kinase PrkC [Bacteroidales bacterium Barb6]